MKKFVQLVLLMTLPLVVIASPLKEGTLSVLLFSEGKPLTANEVKVDGKKVYKTDEDGAVKIRLVAGRHQVEIFGKNTAGENLGYFKKPVSIKEGRDTEIIATLSKTEADTIDIDVPVAVAASVEREAQKATGEGRLTGQVLSSEGNTPIVGARVFVRGTAVDARTDDKGRFSVKVPSGKTLSISVVHSAYSAQTIGGISVKKDGKTSKTIKLTPASMELEEFVVLAPKIEGSIADILQEEKQSNSIANVIGAEQFAKKGDSSASSSLKRVAGLTVVGDGDIYVRGLGERYSNIELNSMPLPSPNPVKRVVPVDVFPSSVIGSLMIQKSPTADIPGNFGGGYIDIRTKDVNDEDFIKVTLGTEVHSSFGKTGLNYAGSTTDFLGFDNGYRDIPQNILDATSPTVGERPVVLSLFEGFTKEDIYNYTTNFFQRDYTLYRTDSSYVPSYNVSITGSKNYDLDDENRISIYGTYNYDTKARYRQEKTFGYFLKATGEFETVPDREGLDEISTYTYQQNAMFNIAYNFADVFDIKFTKLFLLDSEKRAKSTQGILGSDYLDMIISQLQWEEKTIDTNQVTGNMRFYALTDHEFSFGYEHALAKLDIPNDLDYRYVDYGDGYEYYASSTNLYSTNIFTEDVLDALYLKDKLGLDIFNDEDYLEVGINIQQKNRESKTNRYHFEHNALTDDIVKSSIFEIINNIVNSDSYDDLDFTLQTLYQPSDYYDAELNEKYTFANLFVKPSDSLELVLGAKNVDLSEKIFLLKEDPADNRRLYIDESEISINRVLPSASLKYKFNDKDQVKAAYGQSYVYPDFREFSDASFQHPDEVAYIIGNPNLKPTFIDNFDIKYEHYFSDLEYVSLSAFYKNLENPIEDALLPSTSLPLYTYINTEKAEMYGLEIDFSKNFDFLSSSYTKKLEYYIGDFSKYYIAGNASFINSSVTLSDTQKDLYTTQDRELQGLSPKIYNLTLGYDNQKDRSILFTFNKMGERLRKVGVVQNSLERYPDIYETPPYLLDFVWIENFDFGLSAKLKLGNILDDSTVWTQGGRLIKEFKSGSTAGFSLSYKY